MHKETKAKQIPYAVKRAVWERDRGECILCHSLGTPVAHFISRAQGGLGIEENIVTLCDRCHEKYDQGIGREQTRERIRQYLKRHYHDWDEKKLYYRKENDK